jgi:hypothetical protein
MKIVPVIKSADLERSLRFYTEQLDFERKWPGEKDRETANGVAHLVRDGAELQISRHAGDGVFGSLNRVLSMTWMSAIRLFARGVWTPASGQNLRFIPRQSTKPGACVNLQLPIRTATVFVSARRSDRFVQKKSGAPERW